MGIDELIKEKMAEEQAVERTPSGVLTLSKPVEYNGVTYTELPYDFSNVNGATLLDAFNVARGKLPLELQALPIHGVDSRLMLFAAAAVVSKELLLTIPADDLNEALMITFNFFISR